MYDPVQCKAVGAGLLEVVDAVKDGVQVEDAAAGTAFLLKLSAAANEIQSDSDAAVLDSASGLTDALARRRQNPEPALLPGTAPQ